MKNTIELIDHYHEFFYVTSADTPELLDLAFKLRYEVYVIDCDYKFDNPYAINKIEKDVYDDQAKHCLLFHKPTNKPIGYVRLIPYYENSAMLLPIEHFGIEFDQHTTRKLRTPKSGEISRMTIHPLFRRRLNDQLDKLYNSQSTESKRFRINYLPACLTVASLALMFSHGMQYTFALMDRRLAVLLKKHGVKYDPIGSTIEFNGTRTPYLISCQQTYDNLPPKFKELFKVIHNEINSSKSPALDAKETQA